MGLERRQLLPRGFQDEFLLFVSRRKKLERDVWGGHGLGSCDAGRMPGIAMGQYR
jgi:hypothetical protein